MQKIPSLLSSDIPEKVHQAAGLVMIEVGGPSCAPCVALRPLLLQLVERFGGQVQLYELDPEQEIDAADTWQIRGVPTVLLLRRGQIIERWVGARSTAVYAKQIEKHLSAE